MRSRIDPQALKELASRPFPAFAVDELLLVARRSDDAVLQALRAGDFGMPARDADSSAILRLFRCGHAAHAFDEPAHVWAHFREPQFTAGFAHFLSAGASSIRRERVRSFLVAALAASGAEPMARRIATSRIATFEAVAEEARVDLIVQASTSEGDIVGAVIEAKFGHHLTRGQLPAARRHAATRGLTDDNCVFVVVLPDTADVGSAVFGRPGNRRWRAVSWWNLLRNVEAGITDAMDDRSYRAFRHTLWRQTYG